MVALFPFCVAPCACIFSRRLTKINKTARMKQPPNKRKKGTLEVFLHTENRRVKNIFPTHLEEFPVAISGECDPLSHPSRYNGLAPSSEASSSIATSVASRRSLLPSSRAWAAMSRSSSSWEYSGAGGAGAGSTSGG